MWHRYKQHTWYARNLGIWVVLCYLLLAHTQFVFANYCDVAFGRLARAIETAQNKIAEAKAAAFETFGSIRNGIRLYSGNATKKIDAESFAIFDRIHDNPELDLNSLPESEIMHLKSQGVWELIQRYQAAGRAVQGLNKKLALLYRFRPAAIKRSGLTRYAFWIKNIIAPLLIPDISKIRARRIFQKFIDNPNWTIKDLSERDGRFIEKIGLKPDLERFILDLNDNRDAFVTLSRVQSLGSTLQWTVIGGAAISATALSEVEHKEITLSESLNSNSPEGMHIPEGERFKDWETELILTDSKYWPALIRIRGNFYVFTAEGKIINKVQIYDKWQDINLPFLAKEPSFNTASHTRISLKLSIEKQRELRTYLDSLLKADIQNIPIYRSEIYRVSQVLEKQGIIIPYGIDRFSEWTVDYLKLAKILSLEGSEVIGDIRVARKEPRSFVQETAAIRESLLENFVYLQMAKVLVPTSILIDIIHPEKARIRRP